MIDPKEINKIIGLSHKLGDTPQKIIEMMQHHTEEISELYRNKNKHFAIETGDLIILAAQLLIMEGYQTEKIMETCYKRFDKKLNELLEKNDK